MRVGEKVHSLLLPVAIIKSILCAARGKVISRKRHRSRTANVCDTFTIIIIAII